MDELEQKAQDVQDAPAAAPNSWLNTEKIFWAMVAITVVGLSTFVAFGSLVAPASAAVQQPFLPAAQPSGSDLGGSLAPVNGGIQEVALSVQGGSYMPNPIRVKKGVPVRITADLSSVRGCASSIVMPDFGVRKAVRQGDNTIEFTPQQSGTFDFSCSMGMYQGIIVVEESDGSVAAFAGTAPKVAAGSCGGSGGGCGCGG